MILKNLTLQNFRSYRKKHWNLSEANNVIVADNGAGKTNLLEAVYLLATGKSFRAEKDEEMVLYGEEFGRVTGDVHLGGGHSDTSEVVNLTVVLSKPKRFFINNVGKRRLDFAGKLVCVLFRPEDIDLVLGSPSLRREYLDSVLEQIDREYRRCNLSYHKGLRQRNKLLEKIRDGEAQRRQLLFWDELIIKNGEIVSAKREEFINFINNEFKKKKLEDSLIYDKSIISPVRLEQYADNEIRVGKTLVGPHRDDFIFFRQRQGKVKKDLSIFGSRGEQRMAVFNLKLAELEYIEKTIGEPASTSASLGGPPLLLLDDIFSELDHEHREEVFKLLDRQQTIMTTADKHLIPKKLKSVEVIKLS